MGHSGVQKQVLGLYRGLLRATRDQPNMQQMVRDRFHQHRSIRRTEVLQIEFLLRQGRRQLQELQVGFRADLFWSNLLCPIDNRCLLPMRNL